MKKSLGLVRSLALGAGLAAFGAAAPAFADQCQVVQAEPATWAKKILARGVEVTEFCQPCRDKQPKTPYKISVVAAVPWKGSLATTRGGEVEFKINGKAVDLAYLYVRTGANTWTNVAAMVGCNASGVAPFVSVRSAPTGPAVPGKATATPPSTRPLPPPPAGKTGYVKPAPPPPPPATKR